MDVGSNAFRLVIAEFKSPDKYKVLERVRKGRGDEDPAFASLTDQERKVLEQLAEGKTNREIGEVLFLSEKTVKNYVSRILDKLGLARRAEAAAYMAKRRPRY